MTPRTPTGGASDVGDEPERSALPYTAGMLNVGVRALLDLMDEAFEGAGIEGSGESQALVTNLSSVDDAMWRLVPPRGARSIESMVLHVGGCKVMYDDYAFGDGRLRWDDHDVQPWPEGEAPMTAAVAWLRDAHRRLVEHVGALSDEDLERPRMTNWGERRPTRWIVAAMIGHDFYHAGEINHLRSLFAGDDRWRWVQQLDGGTGSP
jgi:hypothetical protein